MGVKKRLRLVLPADCTGVQCDGSDLAAFGPIARLALARLVRLGWWNTIDGDEMFGCEVGSMPIHDWTRVSAGVFHDFHLAWTVHLSASFNNGTLPREYYSMVEQHAGRSMDDVLSPAFNDSATFGRRFVADEMAMYRELRRTVAIRRATTHRLVAMVEMVSPGNKDNAANVAEFVDKAREALRVGCHLLMVDLFPPASYDPSGMHKAIWEAYRDVEDDSVVKPSTALLGSYAARRRLEAYVEAIAIGQALPEMPLFLDTNRYVNVPLESTYQAAYRGMPEVWRNVLEAS